MSIQKKFTLSTKNQLIILILLAIGLNANTLFNEYAIDDVVAFTKNTLVLKGVKGIPEILTTDFFYGIEKKENDLPGGRYRPISLIVFALEYQFFGINPFVSHLINVLLFALLIGMLFSLLQKHIFKEQNKYLAFITCLLFAAHPIHTEVIANVKSRDELIAFILLLAASFAFIRYSEKRSAMQLLSGLCYFFIALLTRESAVPFIGIVPLVAYFFFNQSIKKSVLLSIPLIAVFALYMVIRTIVVGYKSSANLDILNSPFIYASASEAFATKVFILFKYIWLMVFPHPLSCDYGFNQLEYVKLFSLTFILSSLLLTGLLIYSVFTFNKKSLFSFCILYFFVTIFLFSNFIIDIGAPLAERLLFQPSLAFCIVVAALYLKAGSKFNLPAKSMFVVIFILYSAKTVVRNAEWKNNATLYFADVITSPNSVRTNMFVAQEYVVKAQAEKNKELQKAYFHDAIHYDEIALNLYPHHKNLYKDLGSAYLGLKDYFKAADFWLQSYNLASKSDSSAKQRIEMLSDILYNEGNKIYKTGDVPAAINYYKKSTELKQTNADAWHNLSICYYKINDTVNGNLAQQFALILKSQENNSKTSIQKIP